MFVSQVLDGGKCGSMSTLLLSFRTLLLPPLFCVQSAVMSEVKRFTVGASHSSAVADSLTRRTFGLVRSEL